MMGREALTTEIDKVDSWGTMDLVQTPENTMILPSHMVYTVKKDHRENLKRYKARALSMAIMTGAWCAYTCGQEN